MRQYDRERHHKQRTASVAMQIQAAATDITTTHTASSTNATTVPVPSIATTTTTAASAEQVGPAGLMPALVSGRSVLPTSTAFTLGPAAMPEVSASCARAARFKTSWCLFVFGFFFSCFVAGCYEIVEGALFVVYVARLD